MDWSSGDYTQVYADTVYTGEAEPDRGLYLHERGRAPPDRVYAPARAPPGWNDGYVRRPWRGSSEGFYGNVVSDRGDLPSIYGAAWDERPAHYNPSAGAGDAHLLPSASQRPPGGGPAPSRTHQAAAPTSERGCGHDNFDSGRGHQQKEHAGARAAACSLNSERGLCGHACLRGSQCATKCCAPPGLLPVTPLAFLLVVIFVVLVALMAALVSATTALASATAAARLISRIGTTAV
jgi:hypothetical protein